MEVGVVVGGEGGGGGGGTGPHSNNVLDFIIECSNDIARTPDVHEIDST